MRELHQRQDGKHINIFYCDHDDCMRRKIVVYDPLTPTKEIESNGWGQIWVRQENGKEKIVGTYCPFHLL